MAFPETLPTSSLVAIVDALFPVKTNGRAYGTQVQEFGNVEANQIRDLLLKVFLHTNGANFRGWADSTSSPPDVSGAGLARLAFMKNRWHESHAGSDWGLLSNDVDWVNPTNPEYGADRTGTDDSTDAFLAALEDYRDGRSIGKHWYMPAGDYLISDTLILPPATGGTWAGAGRLATRLKWTGAAGKDFLQVPASQHVTLQGFSLWGNPSALPRYMLAYTYPNAPSLGTNPYGFANPYGGSTGGAATANVVRDVLLTGPAVRGNFTTGLFLDDSFGNNSELLLEALSVMGFTDYGLHLPGTQQKAILLWECGFNGGWDGVDHTDDDAGGGKVGIYAQQGAFAHVGGGVSNCRKAAYAIGAPNDPRVLEKLSCEANYRLLGTPDGSAITPSNGRTNIIIKSVRSDLAADHAADAVQLPGNGPFEIDNLDLFANTSPVPYIKLSAQSQMSVHVHHSYFRSVGSNAVSPVQQDTSVALIQYPLVQDNHFVDGSGQQASLPEFLCVHGDAPPTPVTGFTLYQCRSSGPRQGWLRLSGVYTALKANAASQTFDLLGALPKGVRVKSARLHSNHDFVAPSMTDLTAKLGTTSGGDEILKDTSILTQFSYVGDADAQLGAGWTGQGVVPLGYGTAGHLYLTFTATGTNLGTGSASHLTGGDLFVELELELAARFVFGS